MNERDIIAYLQKNILSHEQRGLVRGIGDDCAVIEKDDSTSWLVTMDTLIEGIHFNLKWHPAEKLGRKSVSVNVSDIAAMGGKPVFVFLSLGMPKGFDPDWFKGFSRGITEACEEYQCFLAGGDTVRSREGVVITITAIGEISKEQVVYRKDALADDTIWVSGTLGMAAAGLALCKSGIENISPSLESLVEAHVNPQARVKLGSLLAKHRIAHAMIDLSDGIATDLSHLCNESRTGAVFYAEKLPIDPALFEAANLLKVDPLDLAIRGGEDYELLFTAAPGSTAEIISLGEMAGINISPVGTIMAEPGVKLVKPSKSNGQMEIDVSFEGFDHFSDK